MEITVYIRDARKLPGYSVEIVLTAVHPPALAPAAARI